MVGFGVFGVRVFGVKGRFVVGLCALEIILFVVEEFLDVHFLKGVLADHKVHQLIVLELGQLQLLKKLPLFVSTKGQDLPDFILLAAVCTFERHLINTVLEGLNLLFVGHKFHVQCAVRMQSPLDLLAQSGLNAAKADVLLYESGFGMEG